MIRIGDFLNERYKIISELGHGGMSDVYEARDIIFKRPVAIKIIKFDTANKIENLIRFQNEARFAAAFSHPNIVKIYDFGEHENLPYIVQEFIKSDTLRDILDYKKSFRPNEACAIMLQICDALIEVHSRKIVHRDIKPQNIFYGNDGTVKLGDFGISVLIDSPLNVNENKKVMGTVQYLSPELVYGKKPSFQSDIYALGITFYEIVTSKVPFDDEDPSKVASMQVKQEVPSPLKIIPSLPIELERIIMKCLEKDLEKRYESVEEIKKDILNFMKSDSKKKKKGSFFGKMFGVSK